jgi:hypothetical protein
MKIVHLYLILFLALFISCSSVHKNQVVKTYSNTKTSSTFEPNDGECLVFIGQDLEAIGGLDNYTKGYCDTFEMPAGITLYTGFTTNKESYGYFQKGNDGLYSIVNWGAGDSCLQCILEDKGFDNTIISIGLSMVDNEKKVANGEHDDLISELGTWIKNSKRPIFLRIGYEFDGWSWNHYNKKHYLEAWKRIYSMFKEMNVANVAFVWQSKGNGSNQQVLEDWYPGDELVNWCAYSYFDNPDTEMLTFARKHQKPVFIAEATPTLSIDGLYFNSRLDNPKVAYVAWEQWFIPFFKTINDNKDVIKAFSYINADWSKRPMWITNKVFEQVDSRIQISDSISKKWKEELKNPRYLKASPDLFEKLEK